MSTDTDRTHVDREVEVYDLLYPDLLGEIPAMCATLRDIAPGPSVIEYGVGTGRIALPLADAGFDIVGVDSSPGMLARLRDKDPAGRIDAHLGDFIAERVDGHFDLVLIMVNTAFVAATAEDRHALFGRAAANLGPDGRFVVEHVNPVGFHAQTGPQLQMRPLDPTTVLFEQYVVSPGDQVMIAQNVVLGRGDPITFTHLLHYVYPAEMDAIARTAGLVLEHRWSDWNGTPAGGHSPRLISVYREATA